MDLRVNLDKVKKILKNNIILNKIKSNKIAKSSSKYNNAIEEINKNHNHAWDKEIELRNIDNLEKEALFYRGNVITYKEMFSKRNLVAASLLNLGLKKGDTIPLCMSNTPEFVYTILAASLIGAKVKIFGSHFEKDFIKELLQDTNKSVFIATSDNYLELEDIVKDMGYSKIVVASLSESLKDGVDLFYDFDKKYHSFKPYESEDTISFSEFLDLGKNRQVERADVTLSDDFLVTYTSGSTIVGLPKEIVQQHKSLIVMGRLHDHDLSGLPKMKNVRMLAHIPTYSNTDVITSMSDPLSQGCSVALEPIYDRDFFNTSLVINRPNAVAATRSFWIHAALKYQEEFPNIKQRGLLIPISVGENTSLGEEKLINKFLKEVEAGRDRLPVPAVLSMGGGDCEHGGIYFSLYHAYKSKIAGTKKYGLIPFKGLSQAVLDKEGNHITDGSAGRLVAIGPTTMHEYNNNEEATNNFFVKDKDGNVYGDCKLWATIKGDNRVILHGRIGNDFVLSDGSVVPCYLLAEMIEDDSKNILSCEVVNVKDKDGVETPVVHYSLQPDCKDQITTIVLADRRLRKKLPDELMDKVYYFRHQDEFSLTGSGKRNINDLNEQGLENAFSVRVITKESVDSKKSYVKKI